MTNNMVNAPLMAIIFATSAVAAANPQIKITGMIRVNSKVSQNKSTLYKLSYVAQDKDGDKTQKQGKIYLRIYKFSL